MSEEQNISEENQELAQLKADLDAMTEQAKRAMADFQNFKRRSEEERTQIFKLANESLLKNLLLPLDNFTRAQSEMTEGIKMAFEQFKSAVLDAGLEAIDPEIGSNFAPELHEALLQGEGEKDQILEVLEIGYKLGNKVLRHAKVKVGT